MDLHPSDDRIEQTQRAHARRRSDTCNSRGLANRDLARALSRALDMSTIRYFFGFPIHNAASELHEVAIVCLNASCWQDPPYPTTEIGIADLMINGLSPKNHCEDILNGMRVAHARIMSNEHLLNQNTAAGNPEAFDFGTTKSVSLEEAKKVLINTFSRPRMAGDGSVQYQPIILIGHAVDNLLEHVKAAFGIDPLVLPPSSR